MWFDIYLNDFYYGIKKICFFSGCKMSKHKILNNMVRMETLFGLVGS